MILKDRKRGGNSTNYKHLDQNPHSLIPRPEPSLARPSAPANRPRSPPANSPRAPAETTSSAAWRSCGAPAGRSQSRLTIKFPAQKLNRLLVAKRVQRPRRRAIFRQQRFRLPDQSNVKHSRRALVDPRIQRLALRIQSQPQNVDPASGSRPSCQSWSSDAAPPGRLDRSIHFWNVVGMNALSGRWIEPPQNAMKIFAAASGRRSRNRSRSGSERSGPANNPAATPADKAPFLRSRSAKARVQQSRAPQSARRAHTPQRSPRSRDRPSRPGDAALQRVRLAWASRCRSRNRDTSRPNRS